MSSLKLQSRGLNESIVTYIIVAVISAAAATLFYFLGGSAASVSGNANNFLGVGFKATGTIGGFVLIFMLSNHTLTTLNRDRAPVLKPHDIRFRVRGINPAFSASQRYQVNCTIVHESSGEKEQQTPEAAVGENSLLTFVLMKILPEDRISAAIENDEGTIWNITPFYIWEHLQEATGPQARRSKWREDAQPTKGEISVTRTLVSAQHEIPSAGAEQTQELTQRSTEITSINASRPSIPVDSARFTQHAHGALQRTRGDQT